MNAVEMTRDRKIGEITRVLTYIYAQWRVEVTPILAKAWIDQLHGFSLRQTWAAAKLLMTKKTFGEPKFSDFYECLKEVASVPRTYNPWAVQESKLVKYEPTKEMSNKLELSDEKLQIQHNS